MLHRIYRTQFLSFVLAVVCLAGLACTTRTENLELTAKEAADTTRPVTPRFQSPTAADWYLSHVALLAHDELEGRGTGSDGIDLAAGYIAGQFAAAGLKPGGPNGTYFQEFTVEGRATVLDETAFSIKGSDTELTLHEDYRPFGFSTNGSFSGEVAFVGYGIINPDEAYDDYAGVDTDGRVVLMFRREPPKWGNGDYTNHARFDSKIRLAAKQGAVAVLIVNQDPGEDGIDGLMRFRSRGQDYGLPAVHIKRTVAETILSQGGLPSLNELQAKLDADEHASALLGDVKVRGKVAHESKDKLARNVIGVLDGNGAHAEEYVVIGAHYDHIGKRRGKIYNGADDNASGTAGIIELAHALAAKSRRDRSVIFMAFSAEEVGLVGSRHFTSDPTVDIESIKAMINMDMIGRLTPNDEANKLSIQGLGTGDSFKDIVTRRAEEAELDYTPDDSALGPSDHAPFYRAGVPSLFFFTGVHMDYHQPGDDTEKINVDGAVRIVNLVYNIAVDIINGEAPPAYAEVTERAKVFRGRGPMAQGVVMGIAPDMEDESDAPGWRVAMVMPSGGAAKAGMKAGDRIIKINDVEINGFMDYRQATRDKKPGDVIDVVVKRGKEQLTLSVELAARAGRD